MTDDVSVQVLFAAKKNYPLDELKSKVGTVFGYSDFEYEIEQLIKEKDKTVTRLNLKKAIENYAKKYPKYAKDLIDELGKENILTDYGKMYFSGKTDPATSVEQRATSVEQRATRGQKSVALMPKRQPEKSYEEQIATIAQLLYNDLNKKIRQGSGTDDELQEYQKISEALRVTNDAKQRARLIKQAYDLMGMDIPHAVELFLSDESGASRTDQPFQAQQARGFTESAQGLTSAPAAAAAAALDDPQGEGFEETKEGGESALSPKSARGRGMQNPKRIQRVAEAQKRLASRSRSRVKSKGMSVGVENPASVVVSMNNNAGGAAGDAEEEINEPLPPPVVGGQAGEEVGGGEGGGGGGGEGGGGGAGAGAGMPPPGEGEEETAQITSESTRQSELSASELVSLQYNPAFTEVLDTQFMRLATDKDRGNLGAGTSAEMQSADLWGNLLTQSRPDKITQPERFIPTQPGPTTLNATNSDTNSEDIYSFLPFAKLGGTLVWIPRHVQAARFFFTSDDYTELVSHIRDGNPLTLDATDNVDPAMMRSSITKTHSTLMMFCQLNTMIPASASTEQLYAEWLEMKQIGKAVSRYQHITGGMYENTDLTMKGGIRAAVASALKPFIQAWNQLHPNDTIATDEQAGRPASRPLFSGKRKAESGVVMPEEYNPQFSYEPVDLKRVKFSIPNI